MVTCPPHSDPRLFSKNKQVNLKNKPKIGNFTEKQTQNALAEKFTQIILMIILMSMLLESLHHTDKEYIYKGCQ